MAGLLPGRGMKGHDGGAPAQPSCPRRRWAIVALTTALVLVFAALASPPAFARAQQAPNSRVVLDLPVGYVPAEMFSGFQNETFGTSFVILEAPLKAYPEMTAGFTPEKLATRGILDVTRGTLRRQDDHVYMRGRQSSPAGDYAKYFVLFKGPDVTVLVSANVPQKAVDAGAVKPEEIEAILASASVVARPAVREIYRLGYLGPFKEAGTVVGTSRLYTLDGRMEPERKGELRPTFIVAPSLDKMAVSSTPDLAKRLLQTLSGFKSVKLGEPNPLTIAGMAGVELDAEALDAATEEPLRLYQVLLKGKDGGYFRMIGIARTAHDTALLAEFKRMAESFRLAD